MAPSWSNLNVRGMAGNRSLAQAVADAAFGEIRRQLTYKTQQHGGRVVVADRWYPSSKTCSRCGAVKAKLPLNVRVFECACGLALDRDLNAALNLAALAARTTGTGVAGDQDTNPTVVVSKPRGADLKTRTARTRKGTSTRAGGATLPTPRRGEEKAGDRTQAEALTLW
jgi:putative transposase